MIIDSVTAMEALKSYFNVDEVVIEGVTEKKKISDSDEYWEFGQCFDPAGYRKVNPSELMRRFVLLYRAHKVSLESTTLFTWASSPEKVIEFFRYVEDKDELPTRETFPWLWS